MKLIESKKKDNSKTKIEYEVEIDPVALMSVSNDSQKELNYTQKQEFYKKVDEEDFF